MSKRRGVQTIALALMDARLAGDHGWHVHSVTLTTQNLAQESAEHSRSSIKIIYC
jgi:hypothetical protein